MPVEMGFSPHNAITKSACLYRHKMCILILDIHCPPYSAITKSACLYRQCRSRSDCTKCAVWSLMCTLSATLSLHFVKQSMKSSETSSAQVSPV